MSQKARQVIRISGTPVFKTTEKWAKSSDCQRKQWKWSLRPGRLKISMVISLWLLFKYCSILLWFTEGGFRMNSTNMRWLRVIYWVLLWETIAFLPPSVRALLEDMQVWMDRVIIQYIIPGVLHLHLTHACCHQFTMTVRKKSHRKNYNNIVMLAN